MVAGQFILIDGTYKLNDFNRARMIYWKDEEDEACTFHVGNNPGKFRAPEEYLYIGESEKIDVYSMGNIFYSLMTGRWPFEDQKPKEAQRRIKNNQRPPIDESLRESDDPLDVTLLKAIDKCWDQDPTERASAREVEQFLEAELAIHKNRKEKAGHSGPKKDPPIKDNPTKAKVKRVAKDPPIHADGKV
jgi:serine/threonine protein kinase